MQKTLIIICRSILAIGLLWSWLSKLPVGRLPGDIVLEREGLRLYFPVTTAVLLSLVASLLISLFRRQAGRTEAPFLTSIANF